MGNPGSIEKVMVFGILAIILGILGIAVFGRDDAPTGGTPSALTNKDNLGSIPAKPTKSGGDDIETDTKRASAKGTDESGRPFGVGGAIDIDDKTSPIENGRFPESTAHEKKIDPDADVPVVDPQKDVKKPVDPTPADDTPKTYKVKKGDTLSKIAVDVYHDKKYVDDIQKANPGLNPSKMFENQVIQLPPKKEAPKSSAPSKSGVKGDSGLESSGEKPKLSEGGKTHVVAAGGQKLHMIVKHYYGDDLKKLNAVKKLNAGLESSGVIKDWNNIPAGTVLKLP